MLEKEAKYFLDKFLLGSMKHRKKLVYEPLKITFYLSSPIALTFPWINFDSLVGRLLLMSALEEDFFLLPTKDPISRVLKDVDIPLFPIKETNGMFHSSVSIFDVNRKALEIMYKRFEDRWAGGKKKISRGRGYYRDYMIQHIYIPTRTVIFYVCGDYEILNNLCRYVVGLGDNTRVGWGSVRTYRIEKIDEDWSIVKDGKAMRPIPEQMLEYASEKIALAWRSPYWDPENFEICAPPGAEVRLKNG